MKEEGREGREEERKGREREPERKGKGREGKERKNYIKYLNKKDLIQ